MKKLYLIAVACLASPVFAQISLTAMNVAYTQDFDGLANTGTGSTTLTDSLLGWSILETGNNANSTYTASTGSLATGDTYSYGASGSTDRALGAIARANLLSRWGAHFKNDINTSITQLMVSYTGEEWRLGASGRTTRDQVTFEISTDATSLNTGTWTAVSGLTYHTTDITGSTGLRDGNHEDYKTLISSTITGLNIAPGESFWIRFVDVNITGNDDGLAVDDFSLTPQQESSLGSVESSLSKKHFLKTTSIHNEIIFGVKADVKIYNMSGRVVKEARVLENQTLNVADLQQGIYIVTGVAKGEFLSEKIIKH